MALFEDWKPFKFLRKTNSPEKGKKSGSNEPTGSSVAKRTNNQDPFTMMRERMNRIFDDSFPTLLGSSRLSSDSWFGDFSPTLFSPRVDVTDEKKHLLVTAELPGLTEKDIDLSVEQDHLVLKGEKRHEMEKEENGCYRTERAYGSFQRVVPLPANVDVNGAEANMKNGVLNVRLPKTDKKPASARKIAISGG